MMLHTLIYIMYIKAYGPYPSKTVLNNYASPNPFDYNLLNNSSNINPLLKADSDLKVATNANKFSMYNAKSNYKYKYNNNYSYGASYGYKSNTYKANNNYPGYGPVFE